MTRPPASQALGGSFRDPSGFVFTRDGVLYRQVNRSFAADYDHLMDSGLYEVLVGEGLLVPHEEVDPALAAASGAHRVLRPRPVAFVSYPYEWCPAQLRDAALATLRVLEVALDHGMSLRDASAYNIQLDRGRPVLIDTLSFERLRPGEPWVAYRQFCQHFLAPLALARYVDVRLTALLRSAIDGLPVDLASRLLPRRTWLRPGLVSHLHLHARAQRRLAGATPDGRRPAFSERAFRGLAESLRATVRRLRWRPASSTWSGYYADAHHYSPAASAHKEELVAAFVERVRPASVWDLGANTGRYSRLAAERGAHVVAADADVAAVQAAWEEVRERGEERVLPLVVDLTNPSPALGWASRERASLIERGPADLVLALALVHHLAIGNNVPLERIAAFLARVGRWAVVEWVPKDDERVQQLLAGRQDVFGGYTRDDFEAAARRHFTVAACEPLRDSGRALYLLRGRA